jgi:hypothetical protein
MNQHAGNTGKHTRRDKTLQNGALSGKFEGWEMGTGGIPEISEKPCNNRGFDATIPDMPGWRNWQTHRTQNPAVAIP